MSIYRRRRAPWIFRRRSIRRVHDKTSWWPLVILMAVASGLLIYGYQRFIG